MMRVLDLFSGIGGFSLGLERTGGFETVAFCEIDPFCRKVLAKHWPNVPIHKDITKLRAEDVGPVDLICGGFPCQDISLAGKGAGITGERSGLWKEYVRLVGEIRPRYVFVENVSALLGRGLGDVLGDLAALGYDAEWHCIPASAIGAPHRRDRIWIVAYANGTGSGKVGTFAESNAGWQYANDAGQVRGDMADTNQSGLEGRHSEFVQERSDKRIIRSRCSQEQFGIWQIEPAVGRVANGISGRVDRIRALGNAVVPQIPEMIGNAILEAECA